VSLKLAAGSREPAVVAAVDRALAPYGGKPAVGRADQTSHKFQQERIDRLGISGARSRATVRDAGPAPTSAMRFPFERDAGFGTKQTLAA
jgi:hypothetical protein